MTIFLFVLATIGLANILVHGKILDEHHTGIRPWLDKKLGVYNDLLTCYECTGWWAGLFTSFLLITFQLPEFVDFWLYNISNYACFIVYSVYKILACAFAGSVICSFYDTFVIFITSLISYEVSQEKDE